MHQLRGYSYLLSCCQDEWSDRNLRIRFSNLSEWECLSPAAKASSSTAILSSESPSDFWEIRIRRRAKLRRRGAARIARPPWAGSGSRSACACTTHRGRSAGWAAAASRPRLTKGWAGSCSSNWPESWNVLILICSSVGKIIKKTCLQSNLGIWITHCSLR